MRRINVVCVSATRAPSRALHASAPTAAKVLCVLYPDPVSGFPPKYARDSIPKITTCVRVAGLAFAVA